jgi:integrase
MPKKVVIEDLKLSVDRPSVDAIRYNCKCNAKSIEKCTCNKYFYITGDLLKGEQYRVSSGLVDIKLAREAATEWQRKLKREERELAKRHAKTITGAITIEQLFLLYETAQESGQDQDEIALKGAAPSVGKIKTLRRLLCGHEDPKQRELHEKKYGKPFLEVFNALPREQRLIGANQTIAKIALADDITSYWMAHIFKPTWFARENGGSLHSIRKRKEQLQAVWHHAHKLGELDGMGGGKMCNCPPCSIVIPKKMTKTMKPTPPVDIWRYQTALETCGRYQQSLRDLNAEQLRCDNLRMFCFLAIMMNCGSRRSDTSLMRRSALKVNRAGEVTWVYVPLKNGDENNPLKVPFPRWLYDVLMSLPAQPQFFHPNYFFCSGPKDDPRSVDGGVLLRNAADPWSRAIKRLVQLMPEEARTVDDGRNKTKTITPHMFRDGFCVECYVQGMTDRQIADAVDDDEDTIRRSYSPYHDRQRVRDSVASMEEGVRYVQAALAGLNADRMMREAGIVW